MTISRYFAIVIICFALVMQAAGNVFFADAFDGASDNEPLLYGPNQLEHGIWTSNHKGDGLALLSTDAARSAPRSLALKVGEDGQTQVVGTFSEDGVKTCEVSDGYSLKFAFMMKEAPFPWTFYISGAEGQVAVVQVGDGAVRSYHHGDTQKVFGGLMADTWYILEVNVPAIASGFGVYTVNLYSNENELLGSTNGTFQDSTTSNSTFFTIYHASPSSTLYVDDVTASKKVME